jgi:hypothetical protein
LFYFSILLLFIDYTESFIVSLPIYFYLSLLLGEKDKILEGSVFIFEKG